MKGISGSKVYKSPKRKLVKFFEKSRNQWKAKCQDAKSTVKQLKNRIRFLENSKEQWKQRVKELQEELGRMRAAEQKRRREEEQVLKKKPDCANGFGIL